MFLPSNITLQFGDSGDYVTELQRRLASRSYLSGDMLTGFFDASTVSAVRSFQTASGIRADGVAGPETLRRLNGFGGSSSDEAPPTQAEEDKILFYEREDKRLLLIQKEEEFQKEQALIQREIELGLSSNTPSAGLESTLSRGKELDVKSQDFARNSLENQQTLAQNLNLSRRAELQRETDSLQITERAMEAQNRTRLTPEQTNPQQQAFIDRPIQQTIQTPAKDPALEAGKESEQGLAGLARASSLNNNPDAPGKDGAAKSSAAQGFSQSNAASAFFGATADNQSSPQKSGAADAGFSNDPQKQSTALSANITRSASPSADANRELTTPDFNRIRMQMEARLSPPVIQEVKQVGVVMMENGVNPARMPPSIEAPSQTPNTPERAAGAAGAARGA